MCNLMDHDQGFGVGRQSRDFGDEVTGVGVFDGVWSQKQVCGNVRSQSRTCYIDGVLREHV